MADANVPGRLSGRTALVTGGASGFGEGIVRRFVAEGARVAITDIDLAAARRLAAELGPATLALAVDVSSAARVAEMASEALAQLGPIGIVVNNAGVPQAPGALTDMTEDEFDRILAINAKSVFLTSRAFVPAMAAAGGGAILNIASTGGVRPRPNLTWYNASKGWMIAATRAMAIELAPAGIRVNALNPVAGDTPMLATFIGGDSDEARARIVSTIPLGRLSTPGDMGAAAAFLCSADAAMITGVALEVDGGRCI
jgi:3-oxoacyl-[acyl-carrier protein] reductase